jgi:hypothetical protein
MNFWRVTKMIDEWKLGSQMMDNFDGNPNGNLGDCRRSL